MQKTSQPVCISVDLSAFAKHLFTIRMTLHNTVARQQLSLPVWTPGSYMVREFSQHIVSLAVTDGESVRAVKKINKNCFEIAEPSSTLVVSYTVYGFDSSIRAAFIDDNQAFFNGCSLFLRPHGYESSPFLLTLIRPESPTCATWHVATGMPRVDTDEKGFGTYQAKDYDELVDYPFQVSDMTRVSFEAKGVPHEMVIVGDKRPFDDERLERDLAALCEYHIDLFGGVAPFSSYTFISRFEEGGYGGLEHRNSSMLIASPYGLPKNSVETDAQYRNFLGLCSHEYFHAWNIKRLKPRSFIPFDYDREAYTPLLWIFEGVTSYYDDLALRRAGLISKESYLELMSKNHSKLLRNKGRLTQSLADASFDAWIKFYRPNENSNNVTTSYYLKGSFAALYLDLLIRDRNNDSISLDTVMLEAYRKYGNVGLSEEDFFALLHDVGNIDAQAFKETYIYGVEDLPLTQLLSNYGVHLHVLDDDVTVDDKTKMRAYLGFTLRLDERGRAIIMQVDYDGPAMLSGLSPNDEIVAINHIRFEYNNIAEMLASVNVNDSLEILYTRKKIVKRCFVNARALPKTRSSWALVPNANDLQKLRLAHWLGNGESIRA